MANSDNKITAPVRLTQDVATVVGCGSDLGEACTTANINIYSRHKPMYYNTVSALTTAQKKSIDYGYVHPQDITLVEALLLSLYNVLPSDWTSKASDSNYRALAKEWYYHKPVGTIGTAPYRLLDFNGYVHDVENSLIDTNITTSFVLSQSQSLYASIFQQDYAHMANFWEDSSHDAPMSLGGYTYHAFGIAIAGSGLTQARLQASSAAAQCGSYCKYYVWPSPVSGSNFEIPSADSYFCEGAGTYRIVPFICGSNSAIQAQNNIGSTALALGSITPLPCSYTSCTVSSTPAPTAQFVIVGSPTYGPSGSRMAASWQVSYSSTLHGRSYTASVLLYQGSTFVETVQTTTLTLNGTQSGTYYYADHTMTFQLTPLASGQKFVLKITCGTYTDEEDLVLED